LLLGSRHADERQPPFFFQLLGFFPAAFVRQQAFLHGRDKDDRELQPFGGVQGHDRNAILVLVPTINVAGQGDRFEKVGQSSAGVLGGELMGGGNNFLDVGQAL